MKNTLLIISLIFPLSANAKWIEVDEGLYEILTMNNREGKIIDTSVVGSAQVTTVQTTFNLFRCIHLPLLKMKPMGCYVLGSNKKQ